MIEMRWGRRFRLAAFPLAMNRNDRRELPKNDCRKCDAAKQQVHRALLLKRLA
jgi:hypothetical protein